MAKKLMFFALALGLCFVCGCKTELDDVAGMDLEAEEANVRSVLDQYVQAWEALDMNLFSQVFSHGEDLIVFSASPYKRYVGWKTFSEDVQNSFKEMEKVSISFREVNIKVHASGTVAWLSCLEDWAFAYQGQLVKDAGARVTWILEKRNGDWVTIHAHWSLPSEETTIPSEI